MRTVELIDRESEQCLIPRLHVADEFFSRLFGLILWEGLDVDEGMYFPRCSSIHMFFMSFAIDVVFLNADKKVVKVVSTLKPWRITWCSGACSVLEAPAGWAEEKGVQEGMQVMMREKKEG